MMAGREGRTREGKEIRAVKGEAEQAVWAEWIGGQDCAWIIGLGCVALRCVWAGWGAIGTQEWSRLGAVEGG